MTLIKGNLYSKADFGITFPQNRVSTSTINGEDYAFFTIEGIYNNEFASNGIIVEPRTIEEVVYKNTAPIRPAHIFVRNAPRGKYEYIGDIDIIKPYDTRRNLVVVK